ncbi:MAG: hypothetical protein JNL98_18775 [Bryobacterales bacterium]|nr:hypothetical protein [Bryobacterales bacterium]
MLVALAIATAAPAQAQFVCNVQSTPLTVRAEGVAELGGDVLVTCSGAPGSAAIVLNMTFTASVPITSRQVVGNQTDTLLLVNDPSIPILGTNAFRGSRLSANSIAFSNLTIPAFSSRTFRLVNLRVDATQAGQSGVFVNVEITGTPQSPSTPNPNVTVGFRQAGQSHAVPAVPALTLCADLNQNPAVPATQPGTLRFTEGFPNVHRIRLSQDPSVPGQVSTSESGFVNTAQLGSSYGTASQGTRLMARFAGIPAGARLHVATGRFGNTSLQVVSADANGAGGTPVTGGSRWGGTFVELSIVGGAALAVWEVESSVQSALQSLDIPFVVQFTAGVATTGTANVTMGLGPTSTTSSSSSTAPIPRFAAPSFSTTAFTISSCVIDVTVTPNPAAAVSGQTLQFAASVTGTPNTAVTWSVSAPPGSNPPLGSISSSGLYTPPSVSAPVTVIVTATSVANPSRAGTATVTVNPPVNVTVTPPTATLTPGQSQQFTATVTGAPNASFAWSLTPNTGTMTGTGLYTAPATITSPQTITVRALSVVDGQATSGTATVQLQPPNCAPTLSANSGSFDVEGGTANVNVAIAPGCAWTAASNQAWTVITNGSSGTGNGTVTYTVAPNAGGLARSAVLTIAGLTYNVSQAGRGCSAGLTPPVANLSAAAQTSSTDLTLSSPDCRWEARSNVPWARITSALSGTGSAGIAFAVDANPLPSNRSGTLTIGGLTLTLIQGGGDCSRINLSELNQFFGSAGGTATVEVTAPPGCTYSASTSGQFLTINPPLGRTGSARITYSVAPNPSVAGRTAALNIAGQTVTITQSGAAAPALSCAVQNIANPANLRSTGHTELISPLDIACSGRTGGQSFSADIVVVLNANVTNRIVVPASEELDAELAIAGGGTIKGRLEGINSVRFPRVPIASGEPQVSLRMTISNIRAGVTLLGTSNAAQGVDVTATVQILSPVPVPVENAVVKVGSSRAPLSLSRLAIRDGASPGQRFVPLVIQERFPSAFRTKAMETAGAMADTGTRLLLRISGLTPAAQVFAPAASSNNRARLVAADPNGVGSQFLDGSPRAGGSYHQLSPTAGSAYAVWEIVAADGSVLDGPEFLILIEGVSAADADQVRFEAVLAPLSQIGTASASAPVPRFSDPLNPARLLDLRITGTTQTGSRPQGLRSPVAINGTVTFTYRISNEGDTAASDVVFRSTLAEGFSNGSCTASQGACTVSGQEVRASVGGVPTGAQAVVTVNAAVSGLPNCPNCIGQGTVLENTATVGGAQLDPAPANNSAETQVEVNAPCQFTLGRASATAAGAGSVIRLDVTTGPACEYTQPATENGVSFSPSGTLRGSTTLILNVPANPGAAERVLTINPASRAFNIHQAGQGCTFTLTGPSLLSAAGGNFQLQVQSACAWTAFAGPDWLRIPAPNSGSGNGAVTFTATPNPSAIARVGAIEVAGQIFAVTQQNVIAQTCTYSVSPAQLQAGPAGGASQFTVSTTPAAGCAWTASSNEPWITIASGASGSGAGTVSVNVSPNSGLQRTGTLSVAGQSIGVTQAGGAAAPAGLRFVAMNPCRVMETRPEYNFEGRTGAFGPPFLRAGETRTLHMTQSNVCQIPASAKAYVLNVTLVPRGGVDFVTIWAGGEARPNVWTVRSPDGQIVANSTVVTAGNSAIQVYASNDADLILDISGYFTDAAAANLAYYPLTPCRVIDTRIEYRPTPGPFGPPSMNGRETRRFRFPASPCAVPAGAAAYSVTITAVPQGPLQFLTAWPAGGPQPNISNINSPAGRVLANSVILPASADGSVDVFTFDRTDFLIDINGYFAPDNGQGLFYFPVQQCRVSDSRSANGTFGGPVFENEQTRTYPLPVSACSGIPAAARAYVVNASVIPNGSPMPFLTLWPTGQGRPNASSLNAFEGQIVTNSAIIPAGANGAIDVYAFRRTHVVLEVSGYFGR